MSKYNHFCIRCNQFKKMPPNTPFTAVCSECTDKRVMAIQALQQEAIHEQRNQRGTHRG